VIILGIDIGVTGAVCCLEHGRPARIEDLPITAVQTGDKTIKRLDALEFKLLLQKMIPANQSGLIVMENIQVRQMAGRVMSHATETTLVGLRSAVQAVADVSRIRTETVDPRSWKKHFGIKSDKTGEQARKKATERLPDAAAMFKRVKDHNRAESALIAIYGRETFA
jgi:hypothetical protein